MAVNAQTEYGFDIATPGRANDADELFTEAVGLDIVRQDTIHLLLSDDFLGPGGDGLGFDCRRLIGMSDTVLVGLQPVLENVLERDDRILSASVTLTAVKNPGGANDVLIDVTCATAAGPFTLTKTVGELTSADLDGGE